VGPLAPGGVEGGRQREWVHEGWYTALRIPVHADWISRPGSDGAEAGSGKDRTARKLKSLWCAQWVSPFISLDLC
jgi:hypothetical protein